MIYNVALPGEVVHGFESRRSREREPGGSLAFEASQDGQETPVSKKYGTEFVSQNKPLWHFVVVV